MKTKKDGCKLLYKISSSDLSYLSVFLYRQNIAAVSFLSFVRDSATSPFPGLSPSPYILFYIINIAGLIRQPVRHKHDPHLSVLHQLHSLRLPERKSRRAFDHSPGHGAGAVIPGTDDCRLILPRAVITFQERLPRTALDGADLRSVDIESLEIPRRCRENDLLQRLPDIDPGAALQRIDLEILLTLIGKTNAQLRIIRAHCRINVRHILPIRSPSESYNKSDRSSSKSGSSGK